MKPTIPHFECRAEACSGTFDGDSAIKGCPTCGADMRWTNYVEMFGAQVHEKKHLGVTPRANIAGT